MSNHQFKSLEEIEEVIQVFNVMYPFNFGIQRVDFFQSLKLFYLKNIDLIYEFNLHVNS